MPRDRSDEQRSSTLINNRKAYVWPVVYVLTLKTEWVFRGCSWTKTTAWCRNRVMAPWGVGLCGSVYTCCYRHHEEDWNYDDKKRETSAREVIRRQLRGEGGWCGNDDNDDDDDDDDDDEGAGGSRRGGEDGGEGWLGGIEREGRRRVYFAVRTRHHAVSYCFCGIISVVWIP